MRAYAIALWLGVVKARGCVVGYFVVSVCVGGYFTVRYMDTCCNVGERVLDAGPWLVVGVCFRWVGGCGLVLGRSFKGSRRLFEGLLGC